MRFPAQVEQIGKGLDEEHEKGKRIRSEREYGSIPLEIIQPIGLNGPKLHIWTSCRTEHVRKKH